MAKPKPAQKPESTKKRRARKPAARKASSGPAPLPPPVPVPEVESSSLPDPAAHSSSASPVGSIETGEPAPGSPLPPEAEYLLGGLPEFIGDEPGTSQEGGAADLSGFAEPVSALMAQVAFDEQDVKDTLCEFFEWLAEKYQSDHWKLNERQARMLGRPAAQLANVLWVKLQAMLPDVLGRWCESTPGALGFLTACGLVVGPKVMQQMKISRERKAQKRSMVQPGKSHGGPVPVAQPKRSGMLYTEGSAE